MTDAKWRPESVVEVLESSGLEMAEDRFVDFKEDCPKLSELQARETPTVYVESMALASVKHPDYSNVTLVNAPKLCLLTRPQITAVHSIKYKFQRYLPISEARPFVREGVLIGDGPGVGKTFTLAFALREEFLEHQLIHVGRFYKRSPFKAVWLSSSASHFKKIKETLETMGFLFDGASGDVKLYNFSDTTSQSSGRKAIWLDADSPGIAFMNYATLKAGSKVVDDRKTSAMPGKKRKRNCPKSFVPGDRLKGLMKWLGGDTFDGMLILDESHFSKTKDSINFYCVQTLQESFPNAKVIYSSATSAYDASHFAPMERLGLWGLMTCFKDYESFRKSMANRGNASMELVCLNLKKKGNFHSRQITWKGVEFRTHKVQLTPFFEKVYQASSFVWRIMYKYMQNQEKRQRKLRARPVRNPLRDVENARGNKNNSKFFTAQLRYFENLLLSAKVLETATLARKYAKDKPSEELMRYFSHVDPSYWDFDDDQEEHAVIVALQNTGGESLTKCKHEGDIFCQPHSICQYTLLQAFHYMDISVPLTSFNDPETSVTASVSEKPSKCKSQLSSDTELALTLGLELSSDEDEEDEEMDTTRDGDESSIEEKEEEEEEDDNDEDEDDGDELEKDDESDSSSSDDDDSAASDTVGSESEDTPLVQSWDYSTRSYQFPQNDPQFDPEESFENDIEVEDLEFDWKNLDPICVGYYDPVIDEGDASFRNLKAIALNESKQVPPQNQKEAMIKIYEHLSRLLPVSHIDYLTMLLGGQENVAELTGRRYRLGLDREERNGTFYTTWRKEGRSKTDTTEVNQEECENFQTGKKQYAIISEAASCGIDMHADGSRENQKRRVHIQLQFAFAPDVNVQQMGRCHRTNQITPPIFVFMVSNVPTEIRFTAVLLERLQRLGAASNGDSSSVPMAKEMSENNYAACGQRATAEILLKFKNFGSERNEGFLEPFDTQKHFHEIVSVGLLKKSVAQGCLGNYVLGTNKANHISYLNRIMMLPISSQKALVDLLERTIDTIGKNRKEFVNKAHIFDTCLDNKITELTAGIRHVSAFKKKWYIGYYMKDRILTGPNMLELLMKNPYLTDVGEVCYIAQATEGSDEKDTVALVLPVHPPNENDSEDYIDEEVDMFFPFLNVKVRTTREMITVLGGESMTSLNVAGVTTEQFQRAWVDESMYFQTAKAGTCVHVYRNQSWDRCPEYELKDSSCPFWGKKEMFVLSGDILDVWHFIRHICGQTPPRITRMRVTCYNEEKKTIIGVELPVGKETDMSAYLKHVKGIVKSPFDVNNRDAVGPPILKGYEEQLHEYYKRIFTHYGIDSKACKMKLEVKSCVEQHLSDSDGDECEDFEEYEQSSVYQMPNIEPTTPQGSESEGEDDGFD